MAELLEYKCQCCTGALEFAPGVQKIKCPYCDTEFDINTFLALDEALAAEGKEQMEWNTAPGSTWAEGEADGMAVYVCRSCGGEIVGDETTAATSCPFCGNPVVMSGQLSGSLKPDYVIPFKLGKNEAKAALRKHYSGKRLLPKIFADENHIDEVKGIYVPFWLFDADAEASIRYRATRIRVWSDRNYNYTETSHFSVFRGGNIGFGRVPVDGSSKMADDLMESIEPYDFSDAVDFQTAYLSGYFADKYDVDADASIERANLRIKQSTEAAFSATVKGYSSVVPESTGIRLKNGSAKYALYPVWILNTDWNGKKYTFAMNGQTGKLVGDLPMDSSAYFKWFFGLTAAVGAAAFALSYLIWLL